MREWRKDDLVPLAAMNADPEVMEFYQAPLTREQSDAAVARYQDARTRDGFGFTAAELKSTGELIGIIGIQTMNFAIAGLAQPAVEIGWRLSSSYWGRGLATEGARGMLRYGFEELGLAEIVAVTSKVNARSRRVMEKLGMRHREGLDFDYPSIPAGHWLQKHVLYGIAA